MWPLILTFCDNTVETYSFSTVCKEWRLIYVSILSQKNSQNKRRHHLPMSLAAKDEIFSIKKALDPQADPTTGWSKYKINTRINTIVDTFWDFAKNSNTKILKAIPCEMFTAEVREKKLYQSGEPFLLFGSPFNKWSAMTKWKPKNIIKHYGNCLFNCGENQVVKLSTLMEYNLAHRDDTPLYIFDHNVHPKMRNDYNQNIHTIFPDDLMKMIKNRPPHRWFLFGSKGTGTDVHQDPRGTIAWHLCVSGTKIWCLLHPSLTRSQIFAENIKDDEPSLLWFRDYLPKIIKEHGCKKVLLVKQEQGECLLLPANWWHCVFNLTDVVGITENHVSLSSFCKEMNDITGGKWGNKNRSTEKDWESEMVQLIEHHFGLIDKDAAAEWYHKVMEKLIGINEV